MEQQIHSGGGAVFRGDVTAGRDININHITTVKSVARSLHRSIFTSSDQFKAIQNELASLMGVLESITEDSASFQIDCNMEPALCNLSRECHEILKELEASKQRFDALPTQTQVTWERMEWGAEELADIRVRLTTAVSSLNTVYSRLIHSSTRMIMQKLDTFIDEVRTGKREGSIVTNQTTSSLSADEKEAWRQLRKELESVGITPPLFNQHRKQIIAKLLQAVNDGDLAEDIGEDLSDLQESSDEHLDTEDLTYRPEDVAERPREGPSDITQTSDMDRLAIANATPRSARREGTKTKISRDDPATTRQIIGPSRITKLLLKITKNTSSIVVAAKEDNERLTEQLLRRGANVDSKTKGGQTALWWAARNGNKSLVQELLRRGADGNQRTKDGATPLYKAAEGGHEDVVKLLLETVEIDVDTKNVLGETPLYCAATNGYDRIVKLLLETGGVDVNARNKIRQTPLYQAATNGHEIVLKLLLETGKVDVNPKDRFGNGPLFGAAENGYERIVKLLLETDKVDVDLENYYNGRPLHVAVQKGYEAIVKLLLETGKVVLNSTDLRGETPLMLAVIYGHMSIVKLLLETGKEVLVNSMNPCGNTPLIYAVKTRQESIVKLLLGTGKVNVNLMNHNGETALSLSKQRGYDNINKMLSSTPPVHSKNSAQEWQRDNPASTERSTPRRTQDRTDTGLSGHILESEEQR